MQRKLSDEMRRLARVKISRLKNIQVPGARLKQAPDGGGYVLRFACCVKYANRRYVILDASRNTQHASVFSFFSVFLIPNHFALKMSKRPLPARHLSDGGKWFPPS
jgi:hypothetical protein